MTVIGLKLVRQWWLVAKEGRGKKQKKKMNNKRNEELGALLQAFENERNQRLVLQKKNKKNLQFLFR